uniref:HAT C-terminal dimerisation domain-containing protein n=1 Tax=Panagrolaimus sp. ES5 TaxID=591445 RepID=A0AC34FSP7_9BILA
MILATSLTSAASERTWSIRGFVHSKSRNRLSLSSADKLDYDANTNEVEELQISVEDIESNLEYEFEEDDLEFEIDNDIEDMDLEQEDQHYALEVE